MHQQSNIQKFTENFADLNDPLSCFFSLLPGPASAMDISGDSDHVNIPALCLSEDCTRVDNHILRKIYTRFENNNFVIHRQLKAIAHGIFPLASRLFNHSCAPNAMDIFVRQGNSIDIQIRTIRSVCKDEEVSV